MSSTAKAPELTVVKVWELPVRIVHWGLVAAILVLSVTGFYIGNPFVAVGGEPGIELMAVVKAVHYGTGIVFTLLLLVRVWWAFAGNRYASWRELIPISRDRRRLIPKSVAYYLFLTRKPPPVVGHNPLAGATYVLLYGMLGIEAVTGLAMRGLEVRDGFLWTFFSSWVFDLYPVQTVRFAHHLIMWLTIGFVVHHVYSAIINDIDERNGLLSSMVSGYKTVPKDWLR